MNTSISTNYIEGLKNSFKLWMLSRNIYNPRYATLKTWLEANQDRLPEEHDLDELANEMWSNLGSWI